MRMGIFLSEPLGWEPTCEAPDRDFDYEIHGALFSGLLRRDISTALATRLRPSLFPCQPRDEPANFVGISALTVAIDARLVEGISRDRHGIAAAVNAPSKAADPPIVSRKQNAAPK